MRIWPPPLLEERPRWQRALLAIVLPAAFGSITGILLGVSEGAYLTLSLLAIAGGVGAGFDHRNAAAGAKRGVVGGTLFGAGILVAHEIHGADAESELPEPAILLIVVTIAFGAALGAVGGLLRRRHDAAAAR